MESLWPREDLGAGSGGELGDCMHWVGPEDLRSQPPGAHNHSASCNCYPALHQRWPQSPAHLAAPGLCLTRNLRPSQVRSPEAQSSGGSHRGARRSQEQNPSSPDALNSSEKGRRGHGTWLARDPTGGLRNSAQTRRLVGRGEDHAHRSGQNEVLWDETAACRETALPAPQTGHWASTYPGLWPGAHSRPIPSEWGH